MSKLIIGDIHTKAIQLLPKIDNIIDKYNIDEVYFLGDYIDEWKVSDEEKLLDLELLIDWNNKSKTNNTFLCGNHDLAYIMPIFSCSGHSWNIESKASYLLREKLNVTMSAVIDDYLLTHAGIRNDWYIRFTNELKLGNDADIHIINKTLNEIFNDIKCQLKDNSVRDVIKKIDYNSPIIFIGMCGSSRGGRDHFSGPVWCDKYELTYDPANFNQIVGHTPVRTCTKEEVSKDNNIWFCDTHSLYSNKEQIGDNSILLIDNKDIKGINLF